MYSVKNLWFQYKQRFKKHLLSPRTPCRPPTASNHLDTQPRCAPPSTAPLQRACSSVLQLRPAALRSRVPAVMTLLRHQPLTPLWYLSASDTKEKLVWQEVNVKQVICDLFLVMLTYIPTFKDIFHPFKSTDWASKLGISRLSIHPSIITYSAYIAGGSIT